MTMEEYMKEGESLCEHATWSVIGLQDKWW